jgi:anthranilate synthase/aminodeoxychorismate synthase-like glutamine amidotransferase
MPARRRPRLLLVDHVDSFTHLLADGLRVAGADVVVERAERLDAQDAMAPGFDALVLSPGPGHPADAPNGIAMARLAIGARRPLLGVCLGHQMIALACGGAIARWHPVHGKIERLHHRRDGLFAGLSTPTAICRYHSLGVAAAGRDVDVDATNDAGAIMAISHRHAPAWGVQFHPESIGTIEGAAMLSNFVAKLPPSMA